MTTAVAVKVRRIPVRSASGSPTNPCEPNAVSRATPATVGGSTIGRSTRASSTERPRARVRASQYATGVPRTTARVVESVAVHSESTSALRTGPDVASSQTRPSESARALSPTNGSANASANTSPSTSSSARPTISARGERSAITPPLD